MTKEQIVDDIFITDLGDEMFLFEKGHHRLILKGHHDVSNRNFHPNDSLELELFITICMSYGLCLSHKSFEEWKIEVSEFYQDQVMKLNIPNKITIFD